MRDLLARYIRDAANCPVAIPPGAPWRIAGHVEEAVRGVLGDLPRGFELVAPQVAVHHSAVVASSAMIIGPAVVCAECRIGPGAVVRGGGWIGEGVVIGPHSEVKSSLMFAGAAAAHRNYVGDSIVGHEVNLEAGAVLANHFNERADKQISVLADGQVVATGEGPGSRGN